MGHLPSIFDNTTGLILPVRHQPDSRLSLDIKAMPTTGLLPPPTIPRIPQSVEKKRLSSSDTTSDRIRQARKGYSPSHSIAPSMIGGQSGERRRNSQPAAVPILSASRRICHASFGGGLPACPPAVPVLEDSMFKMYGTLPPIGVQACGGDDGEEEEEESVVDSYTITNSEEEDSDDEVSFNGSNCRIPPKRIPSPFLQSSWSKKRGGINVGNQIRNTPSIQAK